MQLCVLYVEDRRFGHQNVTSGPILGDPFLKERSKAAFGTVARDRFAYLFPGDEGDTVSRALLVEKDKPGSVPYLVGASVDPVEITLLRDTLESV